MDVNFILLQIILANQTIWVIDVEWKWWFQWVLSISIELVDIVQFYPCVYAECHILTFFQF